MNIRDIECFQENKFIKVKARAKINLSLDVIAKRDDGYHDIRTIMQTVKLCDNIIMSIEGKTLELECNTDKVPLNNANIAYRAAKVFIAKYGITEGIKINIEKNIPVSSGLAGGSADAAAVLNGLNELFGHIANEDDLMNLGCELGCDVPFCIKGGTVLAEGTGIILTQLASLPRAYILIVTPDIEISTHWVYENFNSEVITERPDTEILLEYIKKGKIDLLARNMVNVLETVTAIEYPIINKIKIKLADNGSLGTIMSGSGPSVFGIFPDKRLVNKAYKACLAEGWNTCITEII